MNSYAKEQIKLQMQGLTYLLKDFGKSNDLPFLTSGFVSLMQICTKI